MAILIKMVTAAALFLLQQNVAFAEVGTAATKANKDYELVQKATEGIFLSIEDQQLMDLSFSVAEMSNYFAKPYLDKQGLLIFLAGENYIQDGKIDVEIFDFLTEEQRKIIAEDTPNTKNCYIRKHYLGTQPVVFGIADVDANSFDENRKCMILTFVYFAGQSVEELQKISTQEILPIYFQNLIGAE